MIQYTNEQLASVIALPIVTILLVWTTAIFQKNRKKWGPYDIPIVSILVLSILRNLTILAYTLFVTLNQNTIDIDYCSAIVWTFNSIHTFQASSLTTLAIIGLFSAKLHRKHQHIKQFLTATHLVYHLFCLATLCACVGVAAILARTDRIGHFKNVTIFDTNPCKFMPFDLDIKYNVFIIVLNVFLATVSFVAFLAICFNFYRIKRNGFDYLQKSNSDLSDLSLGLNSSSTNDNKNYYDTYTIQRNHHNKYHNHHHHLAATSMSNAGQEQMGGGGGYYENNLNHPVAVLNNNNCGWTSDVSNISNTVSSTNSRRPCLSTAQTTLQKKNEEEEQRRTGLETIHPVLIVCYLFYHLPIIILCIYPEMIAPWPIAGIALWLGLVQDLLIPIGLSIVDTRFCKWVTNVYKCSDRHGNDKLPHVGLDGKFRPFTSQPQSLEITQQNMNISGSSAPGGHLRALQTVEHRFPITNGSLYTSIDGRLPVIHNYRRHQRNTSNSKQTEAPSLMHNHNNIRSVADLYGAGVDYSCRNCETDLCPSHSNLHHLSPHYINKQLNLIHHQSNNNFQLMTKNPLMSHLDNNKRMSLSQESLRFVTGNSDNNHSPYHLQQQQHQEAILKSSRNLVRLNKMRLCKSEDSLADVITNEQRNNKYVHHHHQAPKNEPTLDYSSSDDDDDDDDEDDVYDQINNNEISRTTDNFDSLSSQSSYSITTEANCDFEFFQNKKDTAGQGANSNQQQQKPNMTSFKQQSIDGGLIGDGHFRITRSNSKRSLENFYGATGFVVEDDEEMRGGGDHRKIQRSNSYMTLEDRNRRNNKNKLLLVRSNSKMSDCTHDYYSGYNNNNQKIKSVEYLPSSNASTVYVEDVFYFNYPNRSRQQQQMLQLHHNKEISEVNKKSQKSYVGSSVPDLKKVFISEYI